MKGKREIEDLTYTQLKGLANGFKLKEYTKHRSQPTLLKYIQENVPEQKIDAKLNPGWWKRNINSVGSWASIIGLLLALFIWDPLDWFKACSLENVATFQPLFSPADSTSFNVLIIRFENIANDEDTWCIGRNIQEHLIDIQTNDPPIMPLKAIYADSIPPPVGPEDAKRLQAKHHADLIIYGLANNVQEGCAGVEICFRYNIAEKVLASISPAIKVKTTQHELDYQATSPLELQRGNFNIDALLLKHWATSLASIKANHLNKAILELDLIGGDKSLSNFIRSERYIKIGRTFFDLRQYKKAIEVYGKAIELNPKNDSIYYNRGVVYSKLNRHQLAIQDFNIAIAQNIKFVAAYDQRGNSFGLITNYEKAIDDFNRAIELDSTNEYTFDRRGVTYYRLRKYTEAIKDQKKAIELNPDYAKFYFNLANSFYYNGQHNNVIENYDKAIELDSGYVYAYNNRGFIYYMQKLHYVALEDFNKCIKIDPDYPSSYHNRGKIHLYYENYRKAIDDFNKAAERYSFNSDIFNDRGRAYDASGQFIKAIDDYSRAIEMEPKFIYAYDNRGISYRKIKEFEKAKTDVQKSLSLHPENGWAYATLAMIYADKDSFDLFYKTLDIAIKKDDAYPLKEQSEIEETLKRFKGEERFESLLEKSEN